MLSPTEVRTTVHGLVTDLLRETGPDVPELTGTEELHTLGLSSLALARLILELEEAVGFDPFEQDAVLSDVRSLNDLVTVYQRGLAA